MDVKTVHLAQKLSGWLVTKGEILTEGIRSAELGVKTADLAPKLSEQLVTKEEIWTERPQNGEMDAGTRGTHVT